MTAGQSAQQQSRIWLGGGVSAVVAFVAGVLAAVVLVAAIVLSGAFAASTRAPAPGAAPAYHLNGGSAPGSVPGSLRFTAHAE